VLFLSGLFVSDISCAGHGGVFCREFRKASMTFFLLVSLIPLCALKTFFSREFKPSILFVVFGIPRVG